MNLNTKTLVISGVCILLVAGSIVQYRWLALNNIQLTQDQQELDQKQQALRSLKKNIDAFNSVAIAQADDELLKKDYYDKNISYHNEFGREGVEKIDEVLETIYTQDAFFQLDKLSVKHQNLKVNEKKPKIVFTIDGEKRLVKE